LFIEVVTMTKCFSHEKGQFEFLKYGTFQILFGDIRKKEENGKCL
jgi:hypothetical protein